MRKVHFFILKVYIFTLTELGWMDGWMTCDVTSFLTVFQSYQDDGRMIMEGCMQWNLVYGWEDFASSGDRIQDR